MCVITEYVENGTFLEFIEEKKDPMTDEEVLNYFKQLCHGL